MKWIKDHASSLTAVGGLIFCLLFFTIATGIMGHSIWAPAKLATLLSDVIVTALMSVGAVFIYGLGNMDISIGKQVGLYSTIMVLAGNAMGSLIPAVLLCFVIAVIIGVVNGAAGELLHMYSVVSSVVFMMVISGIITIIYSTVGTKSVSLRGIDTSVFKSPAAMAVVLILEVLVIGFFFNYTRFGKYAKAIGANQEAARQCGVNILLYKVIPYLFLACTLVIATLFQMGYTGSASDSTGTGFEMNVMVALILGGMPLTGGMRAKVSCGVIGAFTFSILDVGLPLIGVPTNLTFFVKAIIFMIVVLIICRKKGSVLAR